MRLDTAARTARSSPVHARMRNAGLALLSFLVAATLTAAEPAPMTIATELLGDAAEGVAVRVTFRFPPPEDVPPGVPLVIAGSVSGSNGSILRQFRYPLAPSRPGSLTAVMTLPPGSATIEGRLLVPLEEEAPVIVAKGSASIAVTKTNRPFVAGEGDGADAILAEGAVPETAGAVKIVPPSRDVAPNLFVVDVETQSVVRRVEFWVDGKKILTRNAPPFRAELDLGKLPKRVEVRAVGYDERGHYVDADAFVVNERETPLEAKIIRTVTPDGVNHFKVSVQNPKGTTIRSAALFAGDRKLVDWANPPYALEVPASRLRGIDFVRVSVIDDTNYEAADLLYLNGERYSETIEVNLVEVPVSVLDSSGAPVTGLAKSDFQLFEDGKPKTPTSFNFASNLPISAGLLIDHSGSMKPRMAATRSAAAVFLRRIIRPGDRAFVAAFSFDPAKVAPFVGTVADLEYQVEAIPDADGGTSLYDAMITGLYRFRGVQGRKALIVLTDGEDTTSRTSYDELLSYVRAARVPIYFIGIGLGISDFSGTSKMKALAAETGGVAWFIRGAGELDATYAKLESDLRSQYLLAYETESSKGDEKYRTVEVKVDRPGTTVRTIRGFLP